MIRLAALALVVALPLIGAWAGGRPAAGGVLMAFGYPGAAACLLTGPAARGAAFYAAGRFREAADAFGADPALAYDRGNALAHDLRFVEAIRAYDQAIARNTADADARFNRDLVKSLAYPAAGPRPLDATSSEHDARSNRGGKLNALHEQDGAAGGHGDAKGDEGISAAGSQGRGKVGQFDTRVQPASAQAATQGFGSAGASAGPGRIGDMLAGISRQSQALSGRDRMLAMKSIRPTREWLQTIDDDPGLFLKTLLRAEQADRLANRTEPGPADDER